MAQIYPIDELQMRRDRRAQRIEKGRYERMVEDQRIKLKLRSTVCLALGRYPIEEVEKIIGEVLNVHKNYMGEEL